MDFINSLTPQAFFLVGLLAGAMLVRLFNAKEKKNQVEEKKKKPKKGKKKNIFKKTQKR